MNGDWRDDEIATLDGRVRDIGEDLVRLGDREAMFEFVGDVTAAAELRATAALLRDRAAGFTDQARKLRAEREPVSQLLPMHMTTRKIR